MMFLTEYREQTFAWTTLILGVRGSSVGLLVSTSNDIRGYDQPLATWRDQLGRCALNLDA